MHVYPSSAGPTFSNAWHNDSYTEFRADWAIGDLIELRVHMYTGEMHVYRNDEFVGVPFTDLPTRSGPLFPCARLCGHRQADRFTLEE